MKKASLVEIKDVKFDRRAEPNEIAVGDSSSPPEVIRLVHEAGFRYVVQRGGDWFDSELRLAKTLIEQPQFFFQRPAESIFGAQAIKNKLEVTCPATETKHSVLAQFESFLKGVRGARPLVTDALMIADELYTNGAKNQVNGVAVGQTQTAPQEQVQFIANADEMRLVFGCVDSFGALDYRTIVKKISNCFSTGIADSIDMGPGGAGIGSFMVFNASLSYYIGVLKGRKTVVLCALPLGRRYRELAELPKSIHVLSQS